MNWSDLKVDRSWTLFLDRDGVINRENKGDYIKNISEFEFLSGALNALRKLSKQFDLIVVLTNQRGIAKNVMTHQDLERVHDHMMQHIIEAGGRIDKIYYCPHEISDNCNCRKPDTGLALQAKEDFSHIDFDRSIFIGDKISDVELGKELGIVTVHVTSDKDQAGAADMADFTFESLQNFADKIFDKD